MHALLANLPADQNLCRKKTTPPTWQDFTCNFAFYQNPKTLCEPKRLLKKTNFILNRNNCWNEKIFYADQNACRKKAAFTFTKTFAKTSRFCKPMQTNHEQSRSHETKPIKTTANQNASEKPWSRFQRLDKINLNLCQRRNHRQTKTPRTWKPACWKNIDQYFTLKSATAKNELTLWTENNHAEKNTLAKK